MSKPDTIAVNIEVERQVYATRADMYVEIKGDSFFSGNTALKKVHEVRDLASALAKVGIEESQIQVVGIRAKVASGIIGKSSTAVYRLCIEVSSLDMLADALGAVMSSKNAALTLLDWHYDGIDELHNKMLEKAIGIAQKRSDLICRESGHDNLGIHDLTEKLRDDLQKHHRYYADMELASGYTAVAKSRRALAQEDIGLEVRHAKMVSLDIRVEYLVKPQSEARQPPE